MLLVAKRTSEHEIDWWLIHRLPPTYALYLNCITGGFEISLGYADAPQGFGWEYMGRYNSIKEATEKGKYYCQMLKSGCKHKDKEE